MSVERIEKYRILPHTYLIPLDFDIEGTYEWSIEITFRQGKWYFRLYERSPVWEERWEPFSEPYDTPEQAYYAALAYEQQLSENFDVD